MRREKCFLAALSVAAIGAALLTWQDRGSDVAQAVRGSLPTAMTRPVASTPAAPAPRPIAEPLDVVPLAEQVDRLIATHDPDNAFLAYSLLSGCNDFNNRHDRLIFDTAEFIKAAPPGYLPGFRGMTEREKQHDTKLCGAMTERERVSRLDYLALAAKAGVPGSAVAFAAEGPFGDPTALKTRPGDALVQEWMALAKAQLIAAADSGADTGAIYYLTAENYNGSDLFEKNLRLAYRYNIASKLIYREIAGPWAAQSQVPAQESGDMLAMGNEFSPDERAAELAAARRIAEHFREQLKRARGKR